MLALILASLLMAQLGEGGVVHVSDLALALDAPTTGAEGPGGCVEMGSGVLDLDVVVTASGADHDVFLSREIPPVPHDRSRGQGERSLVSADAVVFGTGSRFGTTALAFSGEQHGAGCLDMNRSISEALLCGDQEVRREFLDGVDVFHEQRLAQALAHVKRNNPVIFTV